MPQRHLNLPPAGIIILSGIVLAMHVGKIPPALPVLQHALNVSLVQAGFLLSAVQLAGMALGVLAGMTADRIGLRRSLLIGQLILATASFAAMAVTQPIGLLLLRALEGMGFLLAALAAPSLIRQLVRPSQLPLYLGLWSTYMGTGIALALLGGPLALHWLGWAGKVGGCYWACSPARLPSGCGTPSPATVPVPMRHRPVSPLHQRPQHSSLGGSHWR